ncbi:MAG: sulfurtransferase, partial [Bacteroidia bacterium]|nr:sulfurtransferase [Bacteroidia bacterium]
PLPELPDFALVLKRLGINPQSHVVVYDDKHGANAAARFWWMLRSIGHDKVQVLNGGIQAAEKAGFPMSHEPMKPAVVDNYPVEGWKLPMADLPEIQANTENGEYLIVDVREEGRYRGEFEPIDLVAGHIPGAINLPFSTNLGEDGLFLQPEELAQAFHKAFHHTSPDKVAVHCGSGVTACHTLLAMDYAGLVIPKLYVGSWSEWSRNDLEIAREE